jgi:divalent metal cation (Fe/Co/Zn/Cd) transporter
MLDTAPRGEIISKIQQAAASVAGVADVEKCLVRKMGISFYVDLHVGVDGAISVREGHDIAHRVKDAIKQTDARIADVLVHIEPAI